FENHRSKSVNGGRHPENKQSFAYSPKCRRPGFVLGMNELAAAATSAAAASGTATIAFRVAIAVTVALCVFVLRLVGIFGM
ncbi:MAG: hypothetical protein AAF570_23365, partial [Bacteroidota bacterium]